MEQPSADVSQVTMNTNTKSLKENTKLHSENFQPGAQISP